MLKRIGWRLRPPDVGQTGSTTATRGAHGTTCSLLQQKALATGVLLLGRIPEGSQEGSVSWGHPGGIKRGAL